MTSIEARKVGLEFTDYSAGFCNKEVLTGIAKDIRSKYKTRAVLVTVSGGFRIYAGPSYARKRRIEDHLGKLIEDSKNDN